MALPGQYCSSAARTFDDHSVGILPKEDASRALVVADNVQECLTVCPLVKVSMSRMLSKHYFFGDMLCQHSLVLVLKDSLAGELVKCTSREQLGVVSPIIAELK